jgi:hypothetical protein
MEALFLHQNIATRFIDTNQKILREKGALALVERYWQSASNWVERLPIVTSEKPVWQTV